MQNSRTAWWTTAIVIVIFLLIVIVIVGKKEKTDEPFNYTPDPNVVVNCKESSTKKDAIENIYTCIHGKWIYTGDSPKG